MSSLEINLLRVAMHVVSFCMSLRLSRGFIFMIVDIFSGLGSISRWETIYPSSFPEGTQNVHFLGFNFMLNFLRLSKVTARSEMRHSDSQVLTTTSSMSASTFHMS
jgi:hypothetical protein